MPDDIKKWLEDHLVLVNVASFILGFWARGIIGDPTRPIKYLRRKAGEALTFLTDTIGKWCLMYSHPANQESVVASLELNAYAERLANGGTRLSLPIWVENRSGYEIFVETLAAGLKIDTYDVGATIPETSCRVSLPPFTGRRIKDVKVELTPEQLDLAAISSGETHIFIELNNLSITAFKGRSGSRRIAVSSPSFRIVLRLSK